MAAITSGIFAGAMLSSVIATGAGVAGAAAGAATAITSAVKKPKSASAPVYDAEAEKRKAEEAASAQNKKRVLEQTQTVNTSALGNTGKVTTGKTVLGG